MYPIYYSIVLFTFLYSVFKFKSNLIAFIIILSFYSGLAAFPGKFIENPYKILMISVGLFAMIKLQPFVFNTEKDKRTFIWFIVFSCSFFLSSFMNQNNIILILSQYGKFLTPFILFFVLKNKLEKKPEDFMKISILLLLLLTFQIFLSFVKLTTIGITETTVGSVAYMGGGPATIIPILGFIFIWMLRRGQLNKKDWYFVILLIFIAFMSVKRSIWFIMPIMILLFLFYIPKRKLPMRLAWILPLLPILFYLGVRLNPTLNKEQKMWGSFDLDFVTNYVQKYNFGDANKIGSDKKLGQGRGGATLLLLNKLSTPENLTWQDFFGYGLEEFITKDYDNFNESKFGVNSRGAVTGFFNTYISFGFLGVAIFLIYAFSLINYIKNKRLKYVIIGLFIWEYFFYIGMIFSTQAVCILFIYIILYLSKHKDIRMLPIITTNKKGLLPI